MARAAVQKQFLSPGKSCCSEMLQYPKNRPCDYIFTATCVERTVAAMASRLYGFGCHDRGTPFEAWRGETIRSLQDAFAMLEFDFFINVTERHVTFKIPISVTSFRSAWQQK